MFLCCDEHDIHGSVYGLLDRTRDDRIRVGGMWVDATQRRKGIGTALLRAVISRGIKQSRTHFALWVPTHQKAAIHLYQRLGFIETKEHTSFPNHPHLYIMAMELNTD